MPPAYDDEWLALDDLRASYRKMPAAKPFTAAHLMKEARADHRTVVRLLMSLTASGHLEQSGGGPGEAILWTKNRRSER